MHCILCEPYPTISTPFSQLLFQLHPSNSLNSCHTAFQCTVFCVTLIPSLVLLSLSYFFSFSPATPWTAATQQSYALYAVWPSSQAACCSESCYITSSTVICLLNCVISFVEIPHNELHIFHVQYLFEKWFCKKREVVDPRVNCRKKSGVSIQISILKSNWCTLCNYINIKID